jgi:hypothetical protein
MQDSWAQTDNAQVGQLNASKKKYGMAPDMSAYNDAYSGVYGTLSMGLWATWVVLGKA